MLNTKLNRRRLLGLVSGATLAGLTGCGGGAGSAGSAPTRAVQERVGTISRKLFSGSMLFSAVDGIGNARPGMSGGPVASSMPTGGMPQLGAFLKNVAMDGPSTRAHRAATTGSEGGLIPVDPLPPIFWEPQPSFYFDYYLGLWVQTSYKAGESRYELFEDEGKAKPAGSIVTTWPTSWETFPQTWKSHYEFTAGFLKGSHGFSENVTNAGWSGSSTYENVYVDGWKDTGKSTWSGRGDSSWINRTESGDGKDWTESAGSWRGDGSGGTRMSTSDGYEAIFTFNSEGSGHGRISGPEAGLPATITWDTQGNVTIRYADGTVERFNRWGIYPGPTPLPGDGTVVPMLGGAGTLITKAL